MTHIRLAVALCFITACSPREGRPRCTGTEGREPAMTSSAPPDDAPDPRLGPATDASSSEAPPRPESIVGPEIARLAARIEDLTKRAPRVRPKVTTEGEDATSGFSTVSWAAADGTPWKLRSVWNGGCCYAPEVRELIVDGDEVLKETFFMAPRSDADALMRGAEARAPIVIEELYFREGELVLWAEQQGRLHVDGTLDPQRWHERGARSQGLFAELSSAR